MTNNLFLKNTGIAPPRGGRGLSVVSGNPRSEIAETTESLSLIFLSFLCFAAERGLDAESLRFVILDQTFVLIFNLKMQQSYLEIDGAMGEGGGQVLRTALALSICTSKAFRISQIRAGHKKPGLQRQHLTAVRAAARTISGARLLKGMKLVLLLWLLYPVGFGREITILLLAWLAARL